MKKNNKEKKLVKWVDSIFSQGKKSVIAIKDIREGTRICECTGPVLTKKPKDSKNTIEFELSNGKKRWKYTKNNGNSSSLIEHSANQFNVAYLCLPQGNTVWVIAIKDIQEGEKILADYGPAYGPAYCEEWRDNFYFLNPYDPQCTAQEYYNEHKDYYTACKDVVLFDKTVNLLIPKAFLHLVDRKVKREENNFENVKNLRIFVEENGKQGIYDFHDKDTLTPLMLASLMGAFQDVKALVEAGCNINEQQNHSGKTALFYAIEGYNPNSEEATQKNQLEIIEFLIREAQSAILTQNKDEKKLLDEMVIRSGILTQNRDEKTPLHEMVIRFDRPALEKIFAILCPSGESGLTKTDSSETQGKSVSLPNNEFSNLSNSAAVADLSNKIHIFSKEFNQKIIDFLDLNDDEIILYAVRHHKFDNLVFLLEKYPDYLDQLKFEELYKRIGNYTRDNFLNLANILNPYITQPAFKNKNLTFFSDFSKFINIIQNLQNEQVMDIQKSEAVFQYILENKDFENLDSFLNKNPHYLTYLRKVNVKIISDLIEDYNEFEMQILKKIISTHAPEFFNDEFKDTLPVDTDTDMLELDSLPDLNEFFADPTNREPASNPPVEPPELELGENKIKRQDSSAQDEPPAKRLKLNQQTELASGERNEIKSTANPSKDMRKNNSQRFFKEPQTEKGSLENHMISILTGMNHNLV